MSSVEEHYERLLARHYTWMFGASFAEKVAEQKALLKPLVEHLVPTHAAALAVDLGCGPGFQSVALAELGFAPVLAVDTSAELLAELKSHVVRLPIETRQADLRSLPELVAPGTARAIVCMGDTITHLPSKAGVAALFRAAHDALAPGGVFVLTWRDLTVELRGLDRFLPVRSDDSTIFSCFLEYTSPETVQVHDLVYTRGPEGWALNKSSYAKLRLGAAWMAEQAAAAGLDVTAQGPAGRLLQLVARKP